MKPRVDPSPSLIPQSRLYGAFSIFGNFVYRENRNKSSVRPSEDLEEDVEDPYVPALLKDASTFFDGVLPIELRVIPWYTKLYARLLSIHPFLSLLGIQNIQTIDTKKCAATVVQLLNVMVVGILLCPLINARGSHCADNKSREACLNSFSLIMIESICRWDAGSNVCLYNNPKIVFLQYFVMILLVTAASKPVDVLIEICISIFLSKIKTQKLKVNPERNKLLKRFTKSSVEDVVKLDKSQMVSLDELRKGEPTNAMVPRGRRSFVGFLLQSKSFMSRDSHEMYGVDAAIPRHQGGDLVDADGNDFGYLSDFEEAEEEEEEETKFGFGYLSEDNSEDFSADGFQVDHRMPIKMTSHRFFNKFFSISSEDSGYYDTFFNLSADNSDLPDTLGFTPRDDDSDGAFKRDLLRSFSENAPMSSDAAGDQHATYCDEEVKDVADVMDPRAMSGWDEMREVAKESADASAIVEEEGLTCSLRVVTHQHVPFGEMSSSSSSDLDPEEELRFVERVPTIRTFHDSLVAASCDRYSRPEKTLSKKEATVGKVSIAQHQDDALFWTLPAKMMLAARLVRLRQMDDSSPEEEVANLEPFSKTAGNDADCSGRASVQTDICSQVQRSRHLAQKIVSALGELEEGGDMERYLLQWFLAESVEENWRRKVAFKCFFGDEEEAGRDVHRVLWCSNCVLMTSYVLGALFCIYYFGSQLSPDEVTFWDFSLLFVLLEDLLILRPMFVYVDIWLATSALSLEVQKTIYSITKNIEDIVRRTRGVLKCDQMSIQHVNPACRAARSYPHLSVSRLLIGLNDYDVYHNENIATESKRISARVMRLCHLLPHIVRNSIIAVLLSGLITCIAFAFTIFFNYSVIIFVIVLSCLVFLFIIRYALCYRFRRKTRILQV